MAKYQLGIIYILRDKFQVFTPGLPSLLEFKFVPEIVRDLDVTNSGLLYNLLKIFISNNNIPRSSFIIVIADSASIIKDFISPLPPEQQAAELTQLQEQANEFLEHIPFEDVSAKSIPLANGIRAYGTNKELYESIKEIFMQEGSEILMVLPAIAISPELSAKPSLDASAVTEIFKKTPLMKEFNLLKKPLLSTEPEKKPAENIEDVKPDKKSDNKRIILLAGVFVILIIVLIIVYLNQPQ